MSYTPEGESLNDPMGAMLNSMDKVVNVLSNRIKSSYGWTKEHQAECHELRIKIQDLEAWIRQKSFDQSS